MTFLALLIVVMQVEAQEYRQLYLYGSGQVLYQAPTSSVKSMSFDGSPASMVFNADNSATIPLSSVDSLTFAKVSYGEDVIIDYNQTSVDVINPYSSDGVDINVVGADVQVVSTRDVVSYIVRGTSDNGSLSINSTYGFTMTLESLTLSSSSTAPIYVSSSVPVSVVLQGSSSLADASSSVIHGAFFAQGDVAFHGAGDITIHGNAKHALAVVGGVVLNSGVLSLEANTDGVHCESLVVSGNTASLQVLSTGGDGIDCSSSLRIVSGEVEVISQTDDVKGLKAGSSLEILGGEVYVEASGVNSKAVKASNITISGGDVELQLSNNQCDGLAADSVFTMEGGEISIQSSSYDGKAVKAGSALIVNGGIIDIVTEGDISKGLKANTLVVTDGDITIVASGRTEVINVSGQNVPSYCSAIKVDGDISIEGGEFHITLPSSNNGGKAISADGDITILGGVFEIETHGNGASYTVSGNTKDAYSSSCIKCDGDMMIAAGHFTCESTGAAGKGINAGGVMILGEEGAPDEALTMEVSTSGERVTVSGGGGGGGWPPGGGDYANPKAIKAGGNLTINSGVINVVCQQNQEGGECIESKSVLTINGGRVDVYSAKDDCINATSNITFNGGVVAARSGSNDAIDSNGTIYINGGLVVAKGAGVPEAAFDCDNNQFRITGGICVGAAGSNSSPTTNVCTQRILKISTSSGSALQIVDPSGNVILTFQCHTVSGGGGPGGGGSSLQVLYSDPAIVTGTYTVKYGGTISGGTEWNGYYTGATYSGGQSRTFTVSSTLTNVTAQ